MARSPLFALRVLLLLLLVPGYAPTSGAQPVDSLQLQFAPEAGGRPVLPGQWIRTADDDSVRIDVFRFYVSDLCLPQHDRVVWKEARSYHLIDAEAPESTLLRLVVPEGLRFTGVRFRLGIDSATNAVGAGEGDLDPARGMYWAWQSGYVNLKLEGASPKTPARKHAFQFHLGGFRDGTACDQTVTLPAGGHAITITADPTAFLSGLDLGQQFSLMIPGKEAVRLSQKAAGIFQSKAP